MDISVVKNIFNSILAGKFTKEHMALTLAHLTALNVKSH